MAHPVILPEKYYLDYFNYVLDFVASRYEHVLDQPEYDFYEAFRRLSEDAQCLYIRFSNRKGVFFRVEKINYMEISDIRLAKEELISRGFIRINESCDPAQFRLFTKAKLLSCFNFLEKNKKKEEILHELTGEDISSIHEKEEIAETLKVGEVEFIKLLFFGNRYSQMTEFVVRDVGNIKIEKFNDKQFKPWCESREEALSVMRISEIKTLVRQIINEGLIFDGTAYSIPWKSLLKYPVAAKQGGKLLLEIGKYLEQCDQLEMALAHYKLTKMHPARERTVRLLEKLDRKNEAIDLAGEMMDQPVNASEFIFATDFIRKTGNRMNRSMTRRLKTAPALKISNTHQRVEHAVLAHFQEDGWQGVHSENFVWKGLFGLVFWKEIFDQEHGSFHHPLQREPSDLEDPSFFLNRNDQLRAMLATITSKATLLKHIETTFSEKEGIANRLVIWNESLIPTIKAIVDRVTLKSLKKVLMEMPKNIRDNCTGFPDLFIWKDRDYWFYEIKSPNDQLSAQQLFWLDYLQNSGIKADVLRVTYE